MLLYYSTLCELLWPLWTLNINVFIMFSFTVVFIENCYIRVLYSNWLLYLGTIILFVIASCFYFFILNSHPYCIHIVEDQTQFVLVFFFFFRQKIGPNHLCNQLKKSHWTILFAWLWVYGEVFNFKKSKIH